MPQCHLLFLVPHCSNTRQENFTRGQQPGPFCAYKEDAVCGLPQVFLRHAQLLTVVTVPFISLRMRIHT